ILPQVAEDTAAIRQIVESLNRALQEGRISKEQLQNKDAEIARLTIELHKFREDLAARASEPNEAILSELLAEGDLDGALQLKKQRVTVESQSLSRDLFELGAIHELRSDWSEALAAYRKAWQLERNFEFGFKYAFFTQRQKHFSE